MPRVNKETAKKTKNTSTTSSLRAKRSNPRKKIASSKTPRNDVRKSTRRSLSVPVYSLAGRAAGTLSLPKEVFGQKVNKKLLSQAMRVYITNKSGHFGSTKTRGEVRGSTAKIFRQKGTGRARHGAIRAPIFVGGGIVFGPKPRQVRLDLPKKMKKAALLFSLSSKLIDKNVVGLSGVEKASGKTKEMAKLMSSVVRHQSSDKMQKKVSALMVTGKKQDNIVRAVRNIPGLDVLPANQVNAYEVLKHDLLMITKEAVEKLVGGTTGGKSITSTTGTKTRDTRGTRQSRDTLSL